MFPLVGGHSAVVEVEFPASNQGHAPAGEGGDVPAQGLGLVLVGAHHHHRAVQSGTQSGGKVGPVDAGQPRHRRRGLALLQGLHQGGELGHLLENVE